VLSSNSEVYYSIFRSQEQRDKTLYLYIHYLDSDAEAGKMAEKRILTAHDIDPQRQKEAKEYARIRYRLLVVDLALGGIFGLVLLLSGMSSGLKALIMGYTSQPLLVVAGYFFFFSLVYGMLLLPLEYYGGFVLPHRYGLSTQTLGAWLIDEAKGGLLGLGLGLIVIEVIYYLLRIMPSLWWLVTAIFMLLFTVILANLAPLLIVPLFYKFTPLADEELVGRLMKLAEKANTKVRGVFTINLSSRTKAANAALMGLGNTRRIVLGDTLYADYSLDEIETILAHELGHHVQHDIWWGLFLQSALTLIGLYLAHVGLSWGVRAMGFAGLDDIAALPLLALVMGGFMALTAPLSNTFSRWRERMADEYALRMTGRPQAFVSVMVKLANQNLSQVDPEPWVEFILYSHPAIGKRIQHGQNFERERSEAYGAQT
jgi:STE24 endopeptidase